MRRQKCRGESMIRLRCSFWLPRAIAVRRREELEALFALLLEEEARRVAETIALHQRLQLPQEQVQHSQHQWESPSASCYYSYYFRHHCPC